MQTFVGLCDQWLGDQFDVCLEVQCGLSDSGESCTLMALDGKHHVVSLLIKKREKSSFHVLFMIQRYVAHQ